MGISRADRVAGLGGANAINGSVFFGRNGTSAVASGNWLTAYSADDFKFGTGDFTIEYWFYFDGVSGSNSGSFQISNTPGGINNANSATAGGLALDYENGCVKGIGNNGWFNGSNSVAVNTWNHVAYVRHSGTLQIFTNGVADTSASDSQNYSLTHLAIGGYYTTYHLFSGYISNFRIVKGTAVYSAAFTPPTERLTAIDGTVLLACQSPGNIFQEATGKTLDIRKVTLNDAPPMASRFAPDKGEDYGTTFTDNTKFDTLSYMVPPGGTTAESNRGRAVMMGGMVYPTAAGNVIEYIQIQSGGMTKDFGDLPTARGTGGPVSSSTRGVMCGGLDGPTRKNEIEYITIATTSNALDFGDLSEPIGYNGGLSNQTRGVTAGGNGPSSPNGNNQMQYITIASIGNATDFGDLVQGGADRIGAASPTRGIFFAGKINPGSWTQTDQIDYITIATTGNAQDFGNTSETRSTGGACSSATRAVYGGGYKNTPSPMTEVNTIDYIEIATTGNAVDFGDLTVVGGYIGSTSNGTRGIFTGRMDVGPAGGDTTIDSVTIATLGDAVDWGEMTGSSVRRSAATVSDSHGGIS